MTGYKIFNLKQIIEVSGEDKAKKFLSAYSCPLNEDVENFLKTKAIEFSKQDISQTHLVMASYRELPILVGYFTLAIKYIHISKDILTSKMKSRLSKFAQYNSSIGKYILSSPLIGQIGKNYADGYEKQITGDELLKLACDKVRTAQYILGGKTVYLECEDKPKLREFYESNGFVCFGKRALEGDETEYTYGEYLMQYIKYLK
jgi:hypothetical protein